MTPLCSWRRLIPVLVLIGAAAGVIYARQSAEVLPAHESLAYFPMQIGAWAGRSLPLSDKQLEVLGPGEFLLRDYAGSPIEPPVNLYIAYFPSQRTGDTIHSPKNCLPGAGWTPVESGRMFVQRQDARIEVNRYVVAQGANRALVLYWYQAHGRVAASEYWAKIFLVEDAIRMNRTDGALLRVVTPIVPGESEDAAQQRSLRFLAQIFPLLDRYIPR